MGLSDGVDSSMRAVSHRPAVRNLGMLITIIPVLILVIGILIWALASNPLVKEAGRIMFFCGMLVLTFALARVTWRVGLLDSAGARAAQSAIT